MEENKAGYCALGEPLQIGKIYFCPEEAVFCPAYKSRHRPRPAIKLPTHKSSKVLIQEIKPPSRFSIKTRLQSVGGCKVWVKNKTLLKGHRQRIIGRVFNGPAQKSSKYGTGPTKKSLSTPCQVVPGAYLNQIVTPLYTQKMPKNGRKWPEDARR